jgi:regulator of protease activity HflC (stomatin/prohibitin superfamily)
VVFYQVTDPQKADYGIDNYREAIGQLSATMLRSVIGTMDLERTLISRDKINAMLRGVLDDATGKWGIRVTRVEIKALDPGTYSLTAFRSRCRSSGAWG